MNALTTSFATGADSVLKVGIPGLGLSQVSDAA